MFVELKSTWPVEKTFRLLSSACVIVPRGDRKISSKPYVKVAEQINSNAMYIIITCKLMLGRVIVAFITPAAGQLVWEDLQ